MSSILTVTQLTNAIKSRLEPTFSHIQVRGEITNFKEQSSGHLYFSLKDETSQIQAVLFRGNAQKLSRLPRAGDQVTIQGDLSVYVPRGNYQIIVKELEFAGLGQLLMLLHQRKEKLEKLGYFSAEHKKSLPKYPKRIGVVTSPTGSVIQDILQVLQRRFKGFHLILYPVRVQGEEAAPEIAAAIREMNALNLVDVMIVGRGGGSLEDLWPFNEECVAEAIFASKIPIISAVGHETDVTIADFVADVRAPTPSAAAEICMGEKQRQLENLAGARQSLDICLRHILSKKKLSLKQIAAQPVLSSPYALLGLHLQKFDDIAARFDQTSLMVLKSKRLKLENLFRTMRALNPILQLNRHKERLQKLTKEIEGTIQNKVAHVHRELVHKSEILASLNPKNILEKGYCIPFTGKKGSVIMNASQIHPGDHLTLLFHDGEVDCVVESNKRD